LVTATGLRQYVNSEANRPKRPHLARWASSICGVGHLIRRLLMRGIDITTTDGGFGAAHDVKFR